MQNIILNILLYLLAVYGALSLIIGMVDMFLPDKRKSCRNARLVLLVKDCGQSVEGMVENLLGGDVFKNAMVEDFLTVVDLGSTDDTPLILAKLQEKHECLNVANADERDRIFEGME